MSIAFGEPIPVGDEHAICVSLPEWQHSVGFSCQDPEVLEALKAGYPRFSLHKAVANLEDALVKWASSTPGASLATVPGEAIKLFPTEKMAKTCQKYLEKAEHQKSASKGCVRVAHITLDGTLEDISAFPLTAQQEHPQNHIYAVTYPDRLSRHAWKFWLHTGYGVSSRHSVWWTENASFLRHKKNTAANVVPDTLPVKEAGQASIAMRQHIAGLYSAESAQATIEDVFLSQGGMAAITQTATGLRSLAAIRSDGQAPYRVAVVGFLYTDTSKVLGNILGFDCIHYGHASSDDLDELEADLKAGGRLDALYTEFPTNPLLTVVDLERLHTLAVKYDFILVVDDTIGTATNLFLSPWCDIICTSLTKVYSGCGNVMGGSIVVSPFSRHRDILRTTLATEHEDTYFPLDMLVMHANSLQFEERVAVASRNAECVAELLRRHWLVEEVLFPWGNSTQPLYDKMKRPSGGYGFLLSVRFVRPSAAIAFHDSLALAKGPSFGTIFTLTCPYTILAHFAELEWAAQFGVWEHLVRISVGVEDLEVLYSAFGNALDTAERLCCA